MFTSERPGGAIHSWSLPAGFVPGAARIADNRRVDLGGTITLGGELTVNRLGYGAMRVTGQGIFGPPADRDECRRVLRRAVECGVNFIDTADSYGPDISEDIIADALHPYAKGLVIATKAGYLRPGPDQWTISGDPRRLRSACDGSLKRLRLERIDLYQLHRIDPNVPEADQFGVFADLRREGKINLIGLSEVGVAAIERARQILPVASVQNRYNVGDRPYDDVVAYCEREGIVFIPWYPLGAGSVARRRALRRVAEARRASPFQIAVAWLLARSPAMLPIPGTSKVAHLEENLAAAAIRLDAEEMEDLDRVTLKRWWPF
jgi:pyridoxine 4-dehydrogenase